jgi:heme exporter protein A
LNRDINPTRADTKSALLEVEALTCIRGEHVLIDNLSCAIVPGELLHVCGANGSGKTSLLKTICGLLEPESGMVRWRNEDTSKSESFKGDFIYVGHRDGLKDGLTAFENLSFYQQLVTWADEDKLDEILARLNLLHHAETFTYKLSFGQRRRLAFGRLLLCAQPLWILDEPFTGVDMAGRRMMQAICFEHLENDGMIVMTNHTSLTDTVLSGRIRELQL